MKEHTLLGETIEGYHVATELGFSSAYRSFLGERTSPTAPHERVVVKLWSAAKKLTHKESESLLQELTRLQQLEHPHLLPVLSTGRYKDVPYSLTEYVASGSLDDLLQRKSPGQPMQEEQALSLLAQLGQALHYAHQQQIVHGRIKPHNVLLKSADSVVITDFQPQTLLSSEKTGSTHPSDLSMYLAPEQLAGETTPKSDQYALGCLAYEMLTGTKVFMVPSVNTPGKYYQTKALILPRQLNLALSPLTEEAILTALASDPAQRFEDIPAFLAALGFSATTEEQDQEAIALTSDNATVPELLAIQAETPDQTLPDTQAETPDQVLSISTMPVIEAHDVDSEETESLPREVAEAQLASKTQNTVPFPPTRQRQSNIRKQSLAVILCLLALIIGAGALANLVLPHSSPTVSMSASTPTSVPATPSGISLPPHRTPTVDQTVIPPTPTIIPTAAPTQVPAPTPTPTTTLAKVSLSSLFNNRGAGNWSGDANIDGSYDSYPAEQLPWRPMTVNGVSYQFPTLAPGTNDNINAQGQIIPLPPGHYHQAAFIMTSLWGPATGTLTIQYTDGSSSTTNLTVPDWLNDSNKPSNVANAWLTSYLYTQSGKIQNTAYLYAITVPVDSTRTAKALVLPSQLSGPYGYAEIHVFALTVLP